MDGTVNFYRGWDQYKNGFGHAAGEYWLGKQEANPQNTHYLTRETDACLNQHMLYK